jgi:hypothetical protein
MTTYSNLEMDDELRRRLDALRDAPPREPDRAAQGRAAFLREAEAAANSGPVFAPQAVSNQAAPRHIEWKRAIQTVFHPIRKEHKPMFGTLGTILLVISLIFGGGSVTLAAAQSSLPGDALYAVKTWSEEAGAGLAADADGQVEWSLRMAQRRAEEMRRLVEAGKAPPEALQTRLQAHVDRAISLAAGEPDPQAVQALARVRERLRETEHTLAGVDRPAGPEAERLLERAREMLRDRLQLCESGIGDPQKLRDHLRDRDQVRDRDRDPEHPGWGDGKTPQSQHTPEPARTGTPGGNEDPGHQPWADDGEDHGYRWGATPEPGTHDPCQECTPVHDGSGPGPGEPGGSGDPGGHGDGDSGGQHEPEPQHEGGSGDPGGSGEPGGSGGGSGGGGDHGGSGGSGGHR